ncbi:AraC family transcriptional regulator [Paraburkholderia susongensis]|uniref:Transcriptional regulator, AraC family n=1 Tax=Paraburkholderia susongensis TaxID=1515439 RepID=A0A1X7J6U8_9BURK|nr:AraC family transcriptional regulator [Paraburkholderia susongensis]SMG23232.1 transcriptional regulator, AraC family [Paraburkholderia susongensis]
MESETQALARVRADMVELLLELAPQEGYNLTPMADIRFLRSNRPLTRTPVLYEPGIVIVCQGRKRGYLGGKVYVYDAQHYLVVALPLPFSMETDATHEEPLLAIYLRLDMSLAADVLTQIDERDGLVATEPRGMATTPLDLALGESVLRFLRAMRNPLEAAVLGPALVREIYFRVFVGEQGGSMRAALNRHGNFGRISKALRKIHLSYAEALSVEDLAAEAKMSVPSFHAHFKATTNTSPLQYIKSTRLHQARLLMARQGMTAAAASALVGYESPSQFSREFKRLFGGTPSEEIVRMQQHFAVPEASLSSPFVSSH